MVGREGTHRLEQVGLLIDKDRLTMTNTIILLFRDKKQFYTCAFPPGAPSTTSFFLDQKYTCGYVLGALSTTAVSQPLTLTEC